MRRSHHGLSPMLVLLAILILAGEAVRMHGEDARITVTVMLVLFCVIEFACRTLVAAAGPERSIPQ